MTLGRWVVALALTGTLAAVIALKLDRPSAPSRSAFTYDVAGTKNQSVQLELRRRGSALELYRGGSLEKTQPLARTSGVVIRGAAATRDTLTVDFSGGALVLPGGIRYDGAPGGFDTLRLEAKRPVGRAVYRMTGPGSGTISVRGVRIAFANLEPLANIGTATSAVFELPAGATDATLADDGIPGNGVNRLSGTGFETTDISGASSLTVYLGLGSETFTFLGIDTADPDAGGSLQPLTAIEINGSDQAATDTADDTFLIGGGATPAISATGTFRGGAGNDAFTLGSPGSTLDSLGGFGEITIDGGSHAANPAISKSVTCMGTVTSTHVVGDSLLVDDSGAGASHVYRLEPTTLATRLSRDGSTFDLGGVETLDLDGPSVGANSFGVVGYSSPLQNITVTGGTGADVYSSTNIVVNSLVSATINANVQFDGLDGSDDVTIDTLPNSVSVINGGNDGDELRLVRAGTGAGTELNGDAGDDILRVTTTDPGSQTRLIGGPDNDTIFVNTGQQGSVCTDQTPTAVRVRSMSARRQGGTVLVTWRTAAEAGVSGFNVFRERAGRRVKANRALIPAQGGTTGRVYRFRDRGASRGTLRYRIQAVGADGRRTWVASALARA